MSERADSHAFATAGQGEQSYNDLAVSPAGTPLTERRPSPYKRRTLAALTLLGVAGLSVACGGKDTDAQARITTITATPSPSSAPIAAVKLPFPCGHGGSPGLTSTDANVQNFTGLTKTDIARLLATEAQDIDQCNAPDFSNEGGIPPGTITTAEFQQLSSGDRAVIYVRHVTQGPDAMQGLSESVYSMVMNNADNSASYFSWGTNGPYGQRTFHGAVSALADKPGLPHIFNYQAAIDRQITEGSPSMYEIDMLIYNGPKNDDLSRLPHTQISEQLGEWANDKVVVLPPG
jgi:hypothetical protein